MITSKIGHWTVQGKTFDKKIDALIHATATSSDIRYNYFDSVWEKYDRSKIGFLDLDVLYRQRARDLREKYDYLILYYSGGADSDNILQTFIKNKIKLDAVYIKWPFTVVDSNVYSPNNLDKSPKNFLSEWDFVIKKKLEWLSKEHPEIKIITTDWAAKINPKFYTDLKFDLANQLRSPGDIARLTEFSNEERQLVDSGKRVAAIWGIDKPFVAVNDKGEFGFYFKDAAVCVGYPSDFNYQGLEYFYWTPDAPQIMFEQAYKLFQFFKHNRNLQSLVPTVGWNLLSAQERNSRFQIYTNIVKSIIYSNWDTNTFQADKSVAPQKTDWDSWLFTVPEFKESVDSWNYIVKSELACISEKFCQLDIEGNKVSLLPTRTKIHTLGKFNNG